MPSHAAMIPCTNHMYRINPAPSIVLAPICWDLMEEVQQAQQSEPPSPECPPSKQYVPTNLCTQLIQWVHTAPSSGHWGIQRTTSLLQNALWWPSLVKDVKTHVKACQACAQSKAHHQVPVGLLEPLPIPQCLWSHTSVDFITDLPNSNWYSMLFVTTDRFAKACHLTPLEGLPTAMWANAKALFHQFFFLAFQRTWCRTGELNSTA